MTLNDGRAADLMHKLPQGEFKINTTMGSNIVGGADDGHRVNDDGVRAQG